MPTVEIFTSCEGIARYPYLSRPDTKFDTEGKYKVDLELHPDVQEAKDFLAKLKGRLSKEFPKPPYAALPEGNKFVVRFASSYKPKMFDVYGKRFPEDVIIGAGSVIRVAYTENFYKGFGGGINLYLQAVQVINLVEYEGRDASGFGFEISAPPDEDVPLPGDAPGEDNLPF
uniref:Single-stranded DNA-binding protein n=1 Tax=viral metagenome TaxID=1070528 RepID=A0A6M3JLM1_9ZZZZ